MFQFLYNAIVFSYINGMHLNERTALNNSEKTIEPEDVYHAAQAIFGKLTEGFVIMGYCRKTHKKFIFKITRAKVFDDALEEIKEPLCNWFTLGEQEQQEEES